MKAIWNDVTIAESDNPILLEGNYYFPPDSITRKYLVESTLHSVCPWKGEASYYDIVVNDKINKNAGWYYPMPKEGAKEIQNYVAFWNGVEVI